MHGPCLRSRLKGNISGKDKGNFVLTKGVGTCNDGTLSPFVPLGRSCYEEINLKAESIVVIAVHVPFLMRKHNEELFFSEC